MKVVSETNLRLENKLDAERDTQIRKVGRIEVLRSSIVPSTDTYLGTLTDLFVLYVPQ